MDRSRLRLRALLVILAALPVAVATRPAEAGEADSGGVPASRAPEPEAAAAGLPPGPSRPHLPRTLEEAVARPAWLIDAPDAHPLDGSLLARRPPRYPARAGDRMVFRVAYLGAPVGTLELEVPRLLAWRGQRLAHVVAVARSGETVSHLLPLYDRTEAWIDLDRGVTRLERSVSFEGDERTYLERRYDWEAHYLHLRQEELPKGKVREMSFDFGPHVHSALDLLLGLSRAELAPGEVRSFPVAVSRKIYGFELRLLGRRRIHSPALGEVEVLELRPATTLDGERRSPGGARLLVRAEPPHLPLRLDGWIGTSGGLLAAGISAELVEWKAGRGVAPAGEPFDPPRMAWRTERGMPRWAPPPEIERIRAARGLRFRNRKWYLPGADAGRR